MTTTGAPTVAAELAARVEGETVLGRYLRTVRDRPERTALRWKVGDTAFEALTYAQYAEQVARLAAGLADLGVGRNDRVVLLMPNLPEFHVADLAALACGATPVSIYLTSSPEQIAHQIRHCGGSVAIVAGADPASRLERAIAGLDHDVTTVGIGVVADVAFADLAAHEPLDLDAAAADADPDSLATVIYTSGTTGPPKGVAISQANVLWSTESARTSFAVEPGWRLVSYLPMAHVAERLMSHYQPLAFGYEVTTCPDPTQLAGYVASVRPNVLFGVPRVWERVHAAITGALGADPEHGPDAARAIERAIPLAESVFWDRADAHDRAAFDELDAAVLRPLRALAGLDEIVLALSGGAPLRAELVAWFRGLGVPLTEVYGLSETCGAVSYAPRRAEPGTVGPPMPGVEVRVEPDGELLVRGGNVFAGYLDDRDATAAAFTDGWLRTGDVGTVDRDGYLTIVDRKKELLVTAGGKNVSPANLEAALKSLPLVAEAVAVGDGRPYVGALVTIDPEVAPRWAADAGIETDDHAELARHPDLVREIEQGTAKVMERFSRAERVKRLTVLEDVWLPDSDVLTATAKLRRRVVHERYADTIDALYSRPEDQPPGATR